MILATESINRAAAQHSRNACSINQSEVIRRVIIYPQVHLTDILMAEAKPPSSKGTSVGRLTNVVQCPHHPHAPLIEDHAAGDMICPECGLVVGDR